LPTHQFRILVSSSVVYNFLMSAPDKPALRAAAAHGEPLADFTISFVKDSDSVALTNLLNSLAPDFFVHEMPWYGVPHVRIAVATKGALEREFGWVLQRILRPGGEGEYWWEAMNQPQHFPKGLEGYISEMGLSQPGADDLGQPFDWPAGSP
jgi:hypothetical protein